MKYYLTSFDFYAVFKVLCLKILLFSSLLLFLASAEFLLFL